MINTASNKSIREFIARVMLLAMVLSGCIMASQEAAFAKATNVTLKYGKSITYGSGWTGHTSMKWVTHIDGEAVDLDDEPGVSRSYAYCVQPAAAPPAEGTYNVTVVDDDDTGKISKMRKFIYYSPGSYGYAKVTKKRWFSKYSTDEAYAIAHLALSWIYDGYDNGSDIWGGCSASMKSDTKDMVDDLKNLPDPPEDYEVFWVKVSGKQDVFGAFYSTEYGKIKLQKSSAHTPISDGNPCYNLAGAEFTLYTDSKCSEKAKFKNGDSAVLKTNAQGASPEYDIETGEYYIKETKAPEGYALDDKAYKVEVKKDKTYTYNCKDMPETATVELVLQKVDAETGLPKAQGAASLKDAEYEIAYYAGQFNSESEAKAAKVPSRIWKFKTDENAQIKMDDAHKVSGPDIYKNAAGKYCFPIGTVIIKETKAPEGYKIDGVTHIHKIPSVPNGPVNLDYGKEATSNEYVKRADMMGIKIGDTSMKRLAGVPFMLTSKTTGEGHVIVTDENGQFATTADWNSHDATTNGNDDAVSEDGSIDESKLSDEYGVWFNGYNDPETGARVNNTFRALPYDTYEMRELRCEANKKYDLLTFEFIVKKEGVINLGTLTDDEPTVPEIGTTATDKSTGGHIGNAAETVTLVDEVQYDGLAKGQEYKLKGTLMDKATGKPIFADGKPVTAETTFKAKMKTGKVDVVFKFPGIAVKGKTTVVFESLYQENIELAVHADINDVDQTVVFPEIGTTAALNKDDDIVDTVEYKNLVVGYEYEMIATLVDKEKGKPIKGTETVVKFKPEKPDGTIEVTINASEVKGKTVVVFEECRLDGIVIAEHKDLEDEHQTVEVPEEPETPTKTDSPETGDNTKLWIFIGLFLAAFTPFTVYAGRHSYKAHKQRLEDRELLM